MTNESYITESYLRKIIECERVLPAIASLFLDLMSYTPGQPGEYRLVGQHWDTYNWLDKGEFNMAGGYRVDWYRPGARVLVAPWSPVSITITNRFYQPGGHISRGPLQVTADQPETTGDYRTINNQGKEPIVHKQEESVTLEQSSQSKLTQGLQLDLTAKESTTAGGSVGAFNASVTVDLEQHLGIQRSKEETTNHASTTTRAFSDEITIDAGEDACIVYQKTRKKYTQVFHLNALADISFNVILRAWGDMINPTDGTINPAYTARHLFLPMNHDLFYKQVDQPSRSTPIVSGIPRADDDLGKHGRDFYLKFNSVHEFIGFWFGFDVRAPAMKDYAPYAPPSSIAAMKILKDPETYRLAVDGTDFITHEGDATYSVQDVKGISDDEIAQMFGKRDKPVSDFTTEFLPYKRNGVLISEPPYKVKPRPGLELGS